MRNWPCVLLACLLFSHCGPKQNEVEKRLEDGVEVVINHLEPYQIVGRRSLLLEKILSIDTEHNEILKIGIPDILGFEISSDGEIIIVRSYSGEGDFIYKFDSQGAFIKSFGPYGEGPGELQNPRHIAVDGNDNVLITDFGRYPLQKYNNEGDFLGSYEIEGGVVRIAPGPDANVLAQFMSIGQGNSGPLYTFELSLLDPELQALKILDKLSYSPMMGPGKIRGTEPLFFWGVSQNNIFVANEERAYEIWMYDSSGILKRRMQKDYEQKPMTPNKKKILSTKFPENMRNVLNFPEYLPPIQAIVAADDGILLVSTYDDGDKPGEFMFDIFSEHGAFIGRKSLNVYSWEGHMWMRIRSNKLYCLEVKESGFKELVAYKMTWE